MMITTSKQLNINLNKSIIMYYVAKVYNTLCPSIIMNFEKEEHAKQYAELMSKAGKGQYIVLKQI